ncbi:protealysin inhibitor emfourin [Microbacterium sp. NPDC055903]
MSDPAGDAEVTIVVVRTGGLAGLRRRWQVDASAAPGTPWSTLIERCPWDAPHVPAPGDGHADRFLWSIRAYTGQTQRERELREAEVEGPWRELVDAVRASGARIEEPDADDDAAPGTTS